MRAWKKIFAVMMILILSCPILVPGVKADATDMGDPVGNSTSDNATGADDGVAADNPTSVFVIDNKNCYKGMGKSYSKGYVPKVSKGYATIILPLQTKEKIKDNTIRATLNLGEAQTAPFVYKNYDKDVILSRNMISKNTSVDAYVVKFQLKLKKDRNNGSYPMIVHVTAHDIKDNQIEQDFTIFVNITDGKNPDETETVPEPTDEPETEPAPVFEPKLMVKSYSFSPKSIQAGDEVTAKIKLQNTNKKEGIKNLMITAGSESEFIQLTSASDSIFVDSIAAGGTCEITYKYQMKASTPPGQYDLVLAMEYADEKGNPCSGTGKVKTSVGQEAKIKFDPLIINPEAEIGDTIEAQVNAMNLGRNKIYNVRAELKADGLTPKGTIYIGDIEAGEMKSGTVQVLVGGLQEAEEAYGLTEGTVTFYYENEAGKEESMEENFSVNIKALSINSNEQKEDKAGQWWIIIAVIGVVICIFAGIGVFRIVSSKRRIG